MNDTNISRKPATLNRLRCQGGGPRFRRIGRAVYYEPKELRTQNASLGIQLLDAIRQAFEESRTVEVTTKALIGRLTADPERPWADFKAGKPINPKQLGSMLRQYGIVSETVHPPGEPHAKGYKLERFRDAFQRYLGV